MWDTHITVENLTNRTLRNYIHFFACYHEPAMNFYWGTDGAITPCASGGFNAVADAEQEARLRASPYHAHCERYRGKHELRYFRYNRPVLMSEPRAWCNGARHVLLVQPATCAAITTWINQARDYVIRPPDYDLKPGVKFTARVRHVITPVENADDLGRLWGEFEREETSTYAY
jgi:hypothetical protein